MDVLAVLVAIVVLLLILVVWGTETTTMLVAGLAAVAVCSLDHAALGGNETAAPEVYLGGPLREVTGAGWIQNPNGVFSFGDRCMESLDPDVGRPTKYDCEVMNTTPDEYSTELPNIQSMLKRRGYVSPIPDWFFDRLRGPLQTAWQRFLSQEQFFEIAQMAAASMNYGDNYVLTLPRDVTWGGLFDIRIHSASSRRDPGLRARIKMWAQSPPSELQARCAEIEASRHKDILPLLRPSSGYDPANNLEFPTMAPWIQLLRGPRHGAVILPLAILNDRNADTAHDNCILLDHDHRVVRWFEPGADLGVSSARNLVGWLSSYFGYGVDSLGSWGNLPALQTLNTRARVYDEYCVVWSLLAAQLMSDNRGIMLKDLFDYLVALRLKSLRVLTVYAFYLYIQMGDLPATTQLQKMIADRWDDMSQKVLLVEDRLALLLRSGMDRCRANYTQVDRVCVVVRRFLRDNSARLRVAQKVSMRELLMPYWVETKLLPAVEMYIKDADCTDPTAVGALRKNIESQVLMHEETRQQTRELARSACAVM
jgi:hypothetical protein